MPLPELEVVQDGGCNTLLWKQEGIKPLGHKAEFCI